MIKKIILQPIKEGSRKEATEQRKCGNIRELWELRKEAVADFRLAAGQDFLAVHLA